MSAPPTWSAGAWLRWILLWLGWTLGLTLAGALVGAAVFLAGGQLLGSGKTAAELARIGAKNVGFYAFVWAPGGSILIVLIREVSRLRRLRELRSAGNRPA